jgi:general stress protein 26
MYHKRLNWLWFFAQAEKDQVYSIQSGSKVAHYIQVVQKYNFVLCSLIFHLISILYHINIARIFSLSPLHSHRL